jgi:hypothetical protein
MILKRQARFEDLAYEGCDKMPIQLGGHVRAENECGQQKTGR